MTSTRPYLIRAFYEWIVDNNCTPHIVVNADVDGIDVPREYISSGQIVFNIAMSAVQDLVLGNDIISFQARFKGIARKVLIPISSIVGIYTGENGRGMVFNDEDVEPPPEEEITPKKDTAGSKSKGSSKRGGKPSHLTVVK